MKIPPINCHYRQASSLKNQSNISFKTAIAIDGILEICDDEPTPYNPPESRWNKGLLNIHNIYDSDERMKDLAEYFVDMSDSSIFEICDEAYWTRWGTKENYNRLLPYVHKVQQHKKEILDKICVLEQKAIEGESNIVSKKNDIVETVFNYMNMPDTDLEKTGDHYPIPNAILLYGKASSSAKDDFASWMLTAVQQNNTVISKEFNFDATNKITSFKKLVETIKNYSEVNYNLWGKKTLLKVNGIEDLLRKTTDPNEIRIQAALKNLLEQCAKEYHTTLLVVSEAKEQDVFESSVIPPHRFKTVYLDDKGISSKEQTELDELRKEEQRLNDKSQNVYRFLK